MNPSEIRYNGNLKWLKDRTILFCRYGSVAYGTNTPESDEDFRGIAIPPKEYFHGFHQVFEQAESKEPDLTIFDLRKFMRLAADANPNILELLFVDDSDILVMTPAGERLLAVRDVFVSKKAKHTYSGYARQQMARINTHFRWLKNPPKSPPTRSEFDLPERTIIPADQLAAAVSAVEKKLKDWQLDFVGDMDPASRILVQEKMAESLAEMKIATEQLWTAAARVIGMDENFLALLDRERQYTGRQREWEQYQNWIKTRNPKRAALEAKHGMDTKHAGHLVRLTRMCREILTTGKVIVKRPDAEELLAIRNGAWTYEKLVEWSTRENEELEVLAKNCTILPNAPDRAALDKLCIELVEDSFK